MQQSTEDLLAGLPGGIKALRSLADSTAARNGPTDVAVAGTLRASADLIQKLVERIVYLDDSLTAATTGELPARFDLNQLLLAQRAKAYIKWLMETTDPRDKLVKK